MYWETDTSDTIIRSWHAAYATDAEKLIYREHVSVVWDGAMTMEMKVIDNNTFEVMHGTYAWYFTRVGGTFARVANGIGL